MASRLFLRSCFDSWKAFNCWSLLPQNTSNIGWSKICKIACQSMLLVISTNMGFIQCLTLIALLLYIHLDHNCVNYAFRSRYTHNKIHRKENLGHSIYRNFPFISFTRNKTKLASHQFKIGLQNPKVWGIYMIWPWWRFDVALP